MCPLDCEVNDTSWSFAVHNMPNHSWQATHHPPTTSLLFQPDPSSHSRHWVATRRTSHLRGWQPG